MDTGNAHDGIFSFDTFRLIHVGVGKLQVGDCLVIIIWSRGMQEYIYSEVYLS